MSFLINQFRNFCIQLMYLKKTNKLFIKYFCSTSSNWGPRYLRGCLVERADIVERTVRRSFRELSVPFARTNFMMESFIVRATTLWNEIPNNIKSSTSQPAYKKLLFDWIFQQQNSDI